MDMISTDKRVLEGLIRILENQVTIKEHLGIIKSRSTYDDDEYYRDHIVLGYMEDKLAELRANEYVEE
jgi:hypothetical protein